MYLEPASQSRRVPPVSRPKLSPKRYTSARDLPSHEPHSTHPPQDKHPAASG